MTSPSGTGLHVGAFITSMSLSFGVGLAIWWAASRYQARMHLRSRVVALSSAAHIVETWEEVCLREVEDWLTECPSSADSKLRNLLFGNGDGACTTPGKRAPPFHGSFRSLAYAPGVDLNSWMRLWRVGRYLCAALPDDLMLLERLGYIIKYAAFRRLAVMAEARYYSAAWRYAVGDGNGGGGEACSRIPCLPPWLVGRRPFWIVPLPGRGIGRFLCLPLSYFPIEAILTCTAEETWIKELVELSPLLTGETSFKYLFDSLSTWRALRETRSLMQRRYSLPWQQLWNEIDHLFITHAVPLAKSQLERGKIMCRRFYREKLLEGVELTSGEAIDMDEGNCGPLSVPETGSVGTISGRDTLLRDPRISRRVVLLLRLRTLSHTARVVMNLCASRYYVFIERMLFYLLSSSGSGMEQGMILSDFMRRALWGALAAAVEAVLQSLDDAIRSEILMILREELVYEINVKLSTADEAFLRRLVEEGTGDRGKNPLERSMEYAESAASQILAYFDCEQRRYISLFFGLLSAVLRQEVDVAVFSATVSVSNCYKLSQTVGRWLGVIPNRAIRLELAQMEEESLPVEPRYGLQLMMNVLAEEMGEGVAGVLPSQEQLHQGGGKVAKSRYFISLVVCGGTFHLGHPVNFCPQGTINLSSRWTHLNRLKRLFDTVVEEGGVCAWPWSAFRFSRTADSCSLAKSLRQNAACVREFVLKEMIKYAPLELHTAHSGLKKGLRGSDRIGKLAKITLDEEESALLSSPQATSYIPRKLRFEDVFSKSSRFILRQLGLEVIFAYKAAAWAHENESCTIRMDFLDLVSSPFHRIISQLLLHVVEFMESALFYSLINCRVNPTLTRKIISRLITSSGRGAGNTYHSTEWSATSLMERVTAYRALLKDVTCGGFNSPFRLVQQLSRYLPITVHDASSVNYSKKAVEQRRLWLDTIAHLKELKVDEVGRICGGFNLKKGIDFCGVYFVYPQLRHEVENGSLQPVLSDVTIHFPAGETTAILGKTGSGKSTVLSLIKRMYDPVVAVSLGEDKSVWTKYTGLVDVLRFCLDAQLPPINQSRQENVIMIDGIPLACFSVTFLRNSLGMMEQDPRVFRCLSFLNNLALFTPCTPRERLTAIADLCQCKDFISSRPLAYNSEVGELSAGEKQRLALARAIIMGWNGMGALLLDEPTSHLDGHTEAQLEKATKGFVVGGRFVPTILLVSHRLSVVRSASYIVILGDAQLEFQGPAHGDVLCSNPFFLSVYARQAL